MLEITKTRGAVHAKLSGKCTPEEIRRLLKSKATHLFVNSGTISDISFLTHLRLRELDLVHVASGTPITPVNFLTDLVRLNLATYPYGGELIATGLVNLEHCFLEWGKGGESIFECKRLRYLYLNSFKGRDLAPMATLPRLEVLQVGNARRIEDVAGLAPAKQLRALGLYLCTKLAEVADAPTDNLIRLGINTCRAIEDVDPLSAADLQYVTLANMGPIKSIASFRRCERLEFFWLPESTNVLDGRVRWLMELPNLRSTGFMRRRHYDASPDEVEAVVDRRNGGREWYPPQWNEM